MTVFIEWVINIDQPKVYADVTFLINFCMDFIILWATAKLSGAQIAYGRLIAISLLGGIYGAAYLYPEMSAWYSMPVKIVFSCLFVVLALLPRSWQEFKKCLLYFYGVSFVVAGATLAVSYFINANQQKLSFSYWWLLAGVSVAIIIGRYGDRYLSAKLIPTLLKYPVELHFGNQICYGEGFLDTGNGLRDPLTQRPVVVAEYKLLKKCFPDDCQAAIENSNNDNDRFQALSMSSWASRLRVIPFSSIGQKNGLMVGIRCDEIVVDPGNINILFKNLVVGVYLDQLSAKDSYQLLIPSEILQKV